MRQGFTKVKKVKSEAVLGLIKIKLDRTLGMPSYYPIHMYLDLKTKYSDELSIRYDRTKLRPYFEP